MVASFLRSGYLIFFHFYLHLSATWYLQHVLRTSVLLMQFDQSLGFPEWSKNPGLVWASTEQYKNFGCSQPTKETMSLTLTMQRKGFSWRNGFVWTWGIAEHCHQTTRNIIFHILLNCRPYRLLILVGQSQLKILCINTPTYWSAGLVHLWYLW